MISFEKFVYAIHDAILMANDKILERSEEIFDKYFQESEEIDSKTGKSKKTGTLNPKSVTVEYPYQNSKGEIEVTEVSVPLITMIPMNASHIEKATLKADFELAIIDDEVQLSFPGSKKSRFKNGDDSTRGSLEIVISPQETSEGLRLLVEGYEAALKGQISSS